MDEYRGDEFRGYIVLKFGNRRVVLLSPDGKGMTYTQHLEGGHISFAFDGCQVVGSVEVAEDANEPTLPELLGRIERAAMADRIPVVTYLGTESDGIQFRVKTENQ